MAIKQERTRASRGRLVGLVTGACLFGWYGGTACAAASQPDATESAALAQGEAGTSSEVLAGSQAGAGSGGSGAPTGKTATGAVPGLEPVSPTSTETAGSGADEASTSRPGQAGAPAAGEQESPAPVDLEVVELFSSGCTGDLIRTERRFEVLRDEPSFRVALAESLWYAPDPQSLELPEIDFDHYVVIGAHAGPRGCGPGIAVTAARDLGSVVEVEVTDRFACEEGASDSWPYAFAQVPRLEKPYVFLEREDWPVCSEEQ